MIERAERIEELLKTSLSPKLLAILTAAADEVGCRAYIVGGYVRDLLLDRPSTDIDVVTDAGSIEMAKAVKKALGRKAHLSVFKKFGTAQVKSGSTEIEFVGARKESYRSDSRNPDVEPGTLDDDRRRRDFTINALSISINKEDFGTLIDPFDGIADLDKRIIRTPLAPDTTFSDDPLRMMRAVRFASQLNFTIPEDIKASIRRNAKRIAIVSPERITTEFMKIIMSPKPSVGLFLMDECGLMDEILPEVVALKGAETIEGVGHKDNFVHTCIVVDQISVHTDNPFLRLAALFHDIAKPVTKKYDKNNGWTFYNHNYVGAKMLPRIFRRMRLPLTDKLKYVQKLVNLHMRPAQLADEGVTDSAVRRLLFEAGDDIDDLMTLCEADMTSKNPVKIARYIENFAIVRRKLKEIEEKDRIRNFKIPVSGDEIMEMYHLPQCRAIGIIKEALKEAILDGEIPNEREPALAFVRQFTAEHPELLDNPYNPMADKR